MKTKDSVKTTKDWFGPLTTALALTTYATSAQTPLDTALEVQVTAATTSPVISLNWPSITGRRDPVYVTRTELTATGRGSAKSFTLATNSTTLGDTNAVIGKRYEYLVNQRYFDDAGTSINRKVIVAAGSELPLVENRGRVLLLVDSSMATPLQDELATFSKDLNLEGWSVVRRDVARMGVAPDDLSAGAGAARIAELAAVRSEVVGFYNADKTNSRAVVLLGRIPVPYSGKIMPDGHADHQGAWPADMYYADVNGTWTDSAQNWAVGGRLNNVPGDGKFDQNQAPSALELEVGRIDFAGLPSQPKSEVELLRQYLVRNHAYRNGLAPFNQLRREVLVDDNFGYFNGEAFAAVGWNIGTAVVGRSNARAGKWFAELNSAPVLFAYGCGGGGYTGASGVGGSGDFATKTSRAVFNGLFGSYFGDWNVGDGLLRSSLAGPAESTGLASFWVNRPNWDFSVTALGATIGSTLRYSSDRSVHRTVLGDPTLRVQHRPAVTGLQAVATADGLQLDWESLGLGEVGYHVYRTDAAGSTVRLTGGSISAGDLTGSPISTTRYLHSGAVAGTQFTFTVRPVFRESGAGGIYHDLGLGRSVTTTQPGAPIAVQSVTSRRNHPTGPVDVVLDGTKTESRMADGNLQLVVRFNQAVTACNLSVSGTATVTAQSISGNELTVQLSQVANRQSLRLNLSGVKGADWPNEETFSLPVRVLYGDVDQNGVVETKDASRLVTVINTSKGQAIGANRPSDLNSDGKLDANDLMLTLRQRGQRLN